jgi:energy-converting hydrogenase Eha subunit F
MRNIIRLRLILLLAMSVALFGLVCPLTSHSSTLYERSLKKLEANLKTASPDDFMFVVLGDSRDNDEVFQKILAEAAKLRPLFILHGGDTVYTGRRKGSITFSISWIPLFPIHRFLLSWAIMN